MNYQQEEFVWSATLDKKNPEHNWSPPDSDSEDIDDSIIHKLRIKNAFLSSKAKKEDEFNTIELETTGYKEEEIKCPLVMMKSSSTSQCTVDLSFNRSVKFTLTEGNGPIHLVGSHILEFGNGKEEPEDEGPGVEGGSEGEAEEEEEADEEMTEEESRLLSPKGTPKSQLLSKMERNVRPVAMMTMVMRTATTVMMMKNLSNHQRRRKFKNLMENKTNPKSRLSNILLQLS
uniref:Nucleoplasmin-like protein n=1 Tax=Lepeophtheirus salmonis TaxID=72036 RepID=A7TZ48_LEPSM|nr:nucleoplasmin-like protein [Lepeophtheirus salmonis]